ncbi:MAG: dynamin family protein [Anaerolineae bacterium]|nr:MAG: dynamin family protein [Anaerolineae bacterium]
MLHTVLNETQRELLREERRQLEALTVALARFEAAPADLATLQKSLAQLDELFLLVVVGEFNSGKSAVINALLGQRWLEEGVTPTTAQVYVLKYGAEMTRQPTEEHVLALTLPVGFLNEINIVDTPGTNAVIRRHEEITQDFVPRSDLVLFVTSADRPFTESERAFLERIRSWGKKVVVIINKVDILEEADQIQQVMDFVAENAKVLLGFVPEIFSVSARLAQQAKGASDPAVQERLWKASRFQPLEGYILQSLDQESRIQLKFLNPLGVGQRLVTEYLNVIRSRLDLLRADFETIDNIEGQIRIYAEDMQRDFRFRLSDIENFLHEMEARGVEFFDETVRLARVLDLINTSRVRGAFERDVVADTPRQIDEAVQELIDWMVEKDLRQWQAVMEYLEKRRSVKSEDKIIGQVGGHFEYSRRALLDSVGRVASRVVASYDKEYEAKELAEGIRFAVALAASIEVGAVGLGTILSVALTTTAADITGILAAGALAALGLFVLPSKRRQAKIDLKGKIAHMRQQIISGMTMQFERELEHSLQRIQEAIAPYTRFIRAEREKLEEVQASLGEVESALKLLRARVSGG